MQTQWLTIALCTTILATSVQTALVPTKDVDIVVAGSNPNSTVPSQVTVQKPQKPIVVTEMRVHSEVAMRYVHTLITSEVVNPDPSPQQTTFHVLLPDTAFISGFVMTLAGKSYKAYVKEKEEAKKVYNEAVSQGIGAAYVATKARDSNQFTVSVNVEGNTTATFDLRYEELMLRRNGFYNHVINLHADAFVPILEVVVHIKELQKITELRVPEVRTGNEVDATEKDPRNSKAVIVTSADQQEVTITFTPDLEEQKRLAEIYVEKTKEKVSSNRYIAKGGDNKENKQDSTVLGQFVVQYDVERSNDGEIFVNNGYFVHFFAPTSLFPLNKHVVFVLDTSGSMMGRKIEQLRGAMDAILSDLNPRDYYSIVEFNYGVTVHDMKEAEADQEPPPKSLTYYPNVNSRNTTVTLVPPSLASPENIAKAKVIVSRLKASGGTNIYDALDVALNLVIKGVDQKTARYLINQNEDSNCDVGYIYDESEEENNELEPVIIFLTDGEPTVAETNTTRIISYITEKNSGENGAPLYSLAFGEDADRTFLRKLSLRNNGFMRHIYEAADAAKQLHDFYRQVSSPLVSHVNFFYPRDQIKQGTVSNDWYRIINDGSEVIVVGQIAEGATDLTARVTGLYGTEDGFGRIPYEVFPSVSFECSNDEYLPLERMWAYLTIKQLLDKRDAGDDGATDGISSEKKALALALKYEFVTPLTSLVVVKPNATNSVDVESADKLSRNENLASLGYAAGPASRNIAQDESARCNPQPPCTLHHTDPQMCSLHTFRSDTGASSGNVDFTTDDCQSSVEDPCGVAYREVVDCTVRIRLDFADYSKLSLLFIVYHGLPQASYVSKVALVRSARPAVLKPTGASTAQVAPAAEADPITPALPAKPDVFLDPPAPAVSPLAPYHLEEYGWTSSILNNSADALVVDDNGIVVLLQLTKDKNMPKEVDGNVTCSHSSPLVGQAAVGANTVQVCVYLTQCYAARNITADEYSKSYCLYKHGFAGVCCPSNEVNRNP